MKRGLKQTILAAAVIVSVLIYLFSLWQREPHVDDAWIGEIVYWNATEGHPRSELMRGVTAQESRIIVHHKLLTLGGTALTLLFGFKLYTLKTLSLLFYLVFLLTFVLYVRKKGLPLWVPLLLIITNALIFEFSFVFRPEMMLMAFVFLAWIFLEKVIDNESPNRHAFLSGLFFGLAVATHLNGVFAAMAAGILLLIWFRKSLLAFVPGLLLTTCIYFYDFSPEYGAGFWWYQIAQSPFITVSSRTPWGFVMINILEEQMRFFNSPKEISLTLLSLFSFYLLWKNKIQLNQKKLFFVLTMILLMGVFSAHKTSKYLLLYFPFFMLLIAKAFQFLEKGKANLPPWNYPVFIFLLLSYFAANTVFNVNLALKKYDQSFSRDLLKTYVKEDCSKMNIIAPMNYIFNNIQDFGRIHADLYYTESYAKLHKSFATEAAHFNIDYAFLETSEVESLDLNFLKKSDTLGTFIVLDRTADITVLRRIIN